MSRVDWGLLPLDIVVHVFSFLRPTDRNRASRVCEAWHEAFQHPSLWLHIDFWFFLPSHADSLKGVEKYGKYFKSVFVGVIQMLDHNRENACALLELLSKIGKRRVTDFEIVFTGENPLFYSGQEFLDALSILFSPVADNIAPPLNCLQHVDFCGLSVPIDDKVLNLLADNHPGLEFLDIQNKVIVCKVTPGCILRLVKKCRGITDLRLYHCSMSDDVLEALCQEDRVAKLNHLSIMCRREEKFGSDLSTDAWEKLTLNVPQMRVTLGFDHTCPFNVIPIIMKSVIPVRTLKLETFAECHEQVSLAAAYYSETLTKLVLRTRNTAALEDALLAVARSCARLRSLLVFCVVREETIDEIFQLQPEMRARGSYILKSVVEPEPWVVGVEEGD
ncbi:F-box/LRR-repeat protein 8-like isoform X2 [Mya arenaria]|nr:F-box/LRR-repeat protein 8-like isoform X2 [Mya arenaria]XP_052817350.1 F-box/LRR-repeat protein 8-like isoform X2 [Mya arenaria]XP_052817351.1 F-box/LRR-repeat protein 8-like isoform X2 [Mya arenaria]